LSSAGFHSVTPGDHGVFAVQPRLHQHRARRRIFVGQVVGDRDDGPEPGFA
jgi:hypothetical protein